MTRGYLLVLGVVALLGCATSTGPRAGLSAGDPISVREFAVEGALISYDAPYDAFGQILAEEIAGRLREEGHRAEAVGIGAEVSTPLTVSGRVTRIDAGSRAMRYFVSFG